MIPSRHLGEEEKKSIFSNVKWINSQGARCAAGNPPNSSQTSALPSGAAQQGATQKGVVPMDAGWLLHLRVHIPWEDLSREGGDCTGGSGEPLPINSRLGTGMGPGAGPCGK